MKPKKEKDSVFTSIQEIDRVIPDDFIFLLLRLINYPGKPHPIPVSQILKFRFKYVNWRDCKKFLFVLTSDVGIKLVGKDFIIKEILIPKESAVNIQHAIDNYLKKFIKDILIPINQDPLKYEMQKEYFLKLIQKKLDDGATKIFRLTDNEIDPCYRLFETILMLEKEKYLTIENIYNHYDSRDPVHYAIAISINKRKFIVNKKDKTLPTPFSETIDGRCFLKYFKQGRKILIGRNDSLHCRLIRCLLDPFGIEKSINSIFECLSNKPETETVRKIKKVEYAKKELQKIKEFRDRLEIIINKERKTAKLQWKNVKE